MERCIAYAEMQKESALSEISSKLEKDCTSESPNAFWTRENYFVSLPFNPLEKPRSQKAFVALMSPLHFYMHYVRLEILHEPKLRWDRQRFIHELKQVSNFIMGWKDPIS